MDPELSAGAAAGRAAGSPVTVSGGNGTDVQPASVPTMATILRKRFMLLILLEALLALVLLVAIVWWTMFSGRKGGEPPASPGPAAAPPQDLPPKRD